MGETSNEMVDFPATFDDTADSWGQRLSPHLRRIIQSQDLMFDGKRCLKYQQISI